MKFVGMFFWKLGPPPNHFETQGIMWPMIGKYLSSFAFRCGESVGFFLLSSNGDHQGLVTLPLDLFAILLALLLGRGTSQGLCFICIPCTGG